MSSRRTNWLQWLVAPALVGLVAVACSDSPTQYQGVDDVRARGGPPGSGGGSVSAASTVTSGGTVDLLADQDVDVGDVTVSDDGTDLTVEITTTGDWCVTELHLDAADTEDGLPQNGPSNPVPGRFQINEELDCATDFSRTLALPDAGDDDEVVVAVHTVVEEVASFPEEVLASDQGTNKNGSAVSADRSDPQSALVQDYPDGDFFSLGFKRDSDTGEFLEEGGFVEVGFGCEVTDDEGADFRVWEVTNAPYPEETADVYAWDAGAGAWVLLGTADNADQGPAGTHEALTVSDFDLADAGLASTTMLRIVSTTDPSPHNGNADAYDLDGVEALHDCVVREETAWADGTRFVERGNWGTYITYGVE